LKETVRAALDAGRNQYAPSAGVKELREAVVAHQERFYGLPFDPVKNVTITCGATEGIFAAALALVDPGDEVVMFEPFYDSYVPAVEMAGGTCRFVPLQPPRTPGGSWWFDEAELAEAFGPRTRLVLLNSPHNPTGKVFSRAELEQIASLALKWNARVLSDEVYEHLVFAPARHVPMAALPEMAARTLTLGSAGKTFSFTGWKVGWATGPQDMRDALQAVHQFSTFATPAPFQLAAAVGLGLPDAWYEAFVTDYRRRRDTLASMLGRVGLSPYLTEGTYFVLADLSATGFTDDAEFCRWLITDVGVAAIPPSALYSDAHRAAGRGTARFAFCKSEGTLDAAAARLDRVGRIHRGQRGPSSG
jgi:N-succinyldiaminopimelate aminotransferase